MELRVEAGVGVEAGVEVEKYLFEIEVRRCPYVVFLLSW
jgi:hypothetical protein